MRYDVTGPVRVREWKSLLIMLGVIAVAGGSAWGWFRAHPLAPAATQKVQAELRGRGERPDRFERMRRRRAQLASRPADAGGDGVIRSREDPSQMLVRSRGVNVTINVVQVGKTRTVRASRTYPRGGGDDQAAAELWETARAVLRMQRDIVAADQYYNLTQEQLEKMAAIKMKLPRLTAAQEKRLADLYTATEGKKGAELAKAEKALVDAVAEMPIPEEELDAMHDAATEARTVLRPDQLDLIDGSVDRRSYPPARSR